MLDSNGFKLFRIRNLLFKLTIVLKELYHNILDHFSDIQNYLQLEGNLKTVNFQVRTTPMKL